MGCLNVTISVKDTEPFKKLVKILKRITEDNRISEDIRQEYLKEIEVIMMCEQNTMPADELDEAQVEETTEESTEESEESADE